MFSEPYKLNSLVRHLNRTPVYMIIDRRLNRDHSGYFVIYTLIEPHKPTVKRVFSHDELTPLEAS